MDPRPSQTTSHTSFLKAEYSNRDGLFNTIMVSKSVQEVFPLESKNLFEILRITTILIIACSPTDLVKRKKFKPKRLDFDT